MNARPEKSKAKPSRLWWWFLAVFALQLSAWTAWMIVASHHPVEEVPLASIAPAK
jgi:hypothetical protein